MQDPSPSPGCAETATRSLWKFRRAFSSQWTAPSILPTMCARTKTGWLELELELRRLMALPTKDSIKDGTFCGMSF